MNEIALTLGAVAQGEKQASEDLLPLVYEELRRLAAARMAQEAAGHTLQPTALVHEAWLRLAGTEQRWWRNRAHFFGAAANAMRCILIDRARLKARIKHGGGQVRVVEARQSVCAKKKRWSDERTAEADVGRSAVSRDRSHCFQ